MPTLGFRTLKYIGTTSAAGAISETFNVGGIVRAIFVDKTNSTFADTGDITIAESRTGKEIFNISNITVNKYVSTKILNTDKAGADLTTDKIYDYIPAEDVTITVAQGGDTKTVIIYFYMSDS